MVRIKDEHDLETLRQIGFLIDNENRRLIDENIRLQVELARLHGVPETEQLELSILEKLQANRESPFRIDEKRARKRELPGQGKQAERAHAPRKQPHLPVIVHTPFGLPRERWAATLVRKP